MENRTVLKAIACLFSSLFLSSFKSSAETAIYNKPFGTDLQRIIDRDRIECNASALAVSIQNPYDKIIRSFYSGTSTINGSQKIAENSLFQIGSITKSFTAAIILQLEAENKLTLAMPIAKWLPQYPQWKLITVKQLLNQTSGIFNYSDVPNFKPNLIKNPSIQFSLKNLADLAYNHQPNHLFMPGKGWSYSNTNYILAGLIIEKITGHSFDYEITSRLLGKKYGLLNTYYIEYPQNRTKFLVHSYDVAGKNSPKNTDVTSVNTSWGGPAGALISNSHDVALWAHALFKGNVLQAKQLKEMMTLVSMDDGQLIDKKGDNGYGLGIASDLENFGFNKKYGLVYDHTGGMLGALSYFIYLPHQDIIVGLTTNTTHCNITKIANDVISSILVQ